jgi:hypothetical protein
MKLIINYKRPIYTDNKISKFEKVTEYIIENNTKHGGDIFDNLSLDDIIVKKTITKENMNNTETINKKNIKNKKINNIKLNENFSINDLKELIYYLTEINIENQHIELYNKINKKYELIDYSYENKNLTIQIDTLLNNLDLNSLEYIDNVFVDFNLVNNRNLYIIKSHDQIKRLINCFNIKNENEIDVYDLEDFISNKDNLLDKINQDTEIYNIIYFGFIEKYFPLYSQESFKLYLENEKLGDIYPYLNIKQSKILDKIEDINTLTRLTKDKYNITENIKGLKFKINSYNNIKKYNLQEIFNNIELLKFNNLLKLEIQLFLNDKYIYYEKINILNEIQNGLYLLKNKYEKNIILFLLNITNKKYNLINTNIYILLDEYNNLEIHLIIDELSDISINVYSLLIEQEVNNFINEINKKLNLSINTINEYNLDLDKIDINIFYQSIFNNDDFQQVIDIFNKYTICNLYKIINIDNSLNIIELNSLLIDYDKILDIDFSKYTSNYYEYLLNSELIDKYYKLLNLPNIIISHRIKDIKIEIKNINKNEISIIKNLILYLISKVNIKKNNINKNLENQENKLKKLKELDPVLYIINKKNTQNLYSRKCQSSQQPEIITKSEIKNKKITNYVKYWNFTNNKEEFYHCPNKKYKYVKFLTNLHPQNYCIPCCKKKSVDDIKVKSKYENIHNQCLMNYSYDKKNLNVNVDMKSRYIINYSSKILIENNRLMEMPNILKNIIKKVYKYEIKENVDENIIYNYYIYGINQNISNLHNIGYLYILSSILNKSIKDIIELIKDLLFKNPNLFNILLNGKLVKYFVDIKSFLITFNNIFQGNLLLKNINYEFTKWNELLIDISKYLGIISIIFEEDENENLNLVIPKKIYNIDEYIYNNDKYKYNIVIKRTYKDNIIYYPIYKLNYKQFYNSNIIKYKVFEYNDSLIQIFKQIIEKQIQNNKKESLNIDLINNFLFDNNIYKIERYYINKHNEAYAILIKTNKNEYIYCSIMSQKISNITLNELTTNKLYTYYVFNNEYTLKFAVLYKFIQDLNLFIYKKNKDDYSDIYYKLYGNDILIKNYKIDNIFKLDDSEILKKDNIKYIYINNFILYKDKVIGISINNLNLYITENFSIDNSLTYLNNEINTINKYIKNQKIDKTNIVNILTRVFKLEQNDKKIFKQNNKKILTNYYKIYYYNPIEVNNIIIKDDNINDFRINNLNNALYNTNVYNLFLLEIISKIQKLKNNKLRSKLQLIISNLDSNDINNIINNLKNDKIYDLINSLDLKKYNYTIYEELQAKLKIINEILIFIKNIIVQNKNNKSIKKVIIDKFNNIYFSFDNLYIYELLNKNKKEFINEIEILLKNTISHKKLNTNNQILDLTLCNNTINSYYCDNKKLIISKELYHTLLDIFYYDITNKYKQKILLNLVNYNINNIYKFKYYLNEKIYIYL